MRHDKTSVKKAHATHSKRHTMKAFLAISGFLLLAGFFSWPFINDFLEESDESIPKVSIESIDLEKKKVINPKLVGNDSENQPYTITAASAEQTGTNKVSLNKVHGSLILKDGITVLLDAKKGETQMNKAETVLLYDTVTLTYDKETTAKTQKAMIDLKKGLIFGDNPIEGSGPFGVTSAQRFSFDYKNSVLKLKGKARLIIFNKKR